MCGRFVSTSSPADLASYFGAEGDATVEHTPSWNVAPTTDVFVIHADGGTRRVETFHWGLVPYWAKSVSVGNRMINARAETVADNNAYRRAFRKRRCLIPVDGFYEWHKVPGRKQKQPYFIHRPDDAPYALAGLWEVWRGPERDDSEHLRSCSIITTTPNDAMAEIHDRMPVILPPSAWDQWLDAEIDDTALLGQLLVPAPRRLTVLRPVSAEVNSVRNDGAQLTDEAQVVAAEGAPG